MARICVHMQTHRATTCNLADRDDDCDCFDDDHDDGKSDSRVDYIASDAAADDDDDDDR